MRWTKTLILAAVMLLFAYGTSYGCHCRQLSEEDGFQAADSVFIGRVVSIEPSEGWNKVTFDVSRSLKGDEQRNLSLYQSAFTGDTQFELDGKYLVFANRSEGRLSASNCSNTRPLSYDCAMREQHFARVRVSPLQHFSYLQIAMITAISVTLSLALGLFTTRLWRKLS